MGDIITYAIFLKAFFRLNDTSRDIKGPGMTLMVSLTYLYILFKQLTFGAWWFLDLPMLLLATMFFYGAYRDEDGHLPVWAMVLVVVGGLAIGGVEVSRSMEPEPEEDDSISELAESILNGNAEGDGAANVLDQARQQLKRSGSRQPD